MRNPSLCSMFGIFSMYRICYTRDAICIEGRIRGFNRAIKFKRFVCFFVFVLLVFWGDMGFELFQNELFPDILQYFLNDFWNFQKNHFYGPVDPVLWTVDAVCITKNILGKSRNTRKTLSVEYLNFMELRQKTNSWHHRTPKYFKNVVSYFGNVPQQQSSSPSVFNKKLQNTFWNIFKS